MWTLDEGTRRRYVYGMTRLGIWYVRNLLERGEIRREDVSIALCRRVDLYRFTDFWNGSNDAMDGAVDPRWMEQAARIAAWVQECPIEETDRLEEQALALLQPTLEKRLPKDNGPEPVRPFECWTYELGWVGLAERRGLLGRLSNPAHLAAFLRKSMRLPPPASRNCVLHIMNVLVPQSPFGDMPRLARTLRALIAHVRTRHPQVREAWCNTWLNDHPKFGELLPPLWFKNATVAPPGNYRNWWGQFASRNGDFNEAAAQQFRVSGGVFPFRALLCHADLESIDRHLAKCFGTDAGI